MAGRNFPYNCMGERKTEKERELREGREKGRTSLKFIQMKYVRMAFDIYI